MNENLDNMRTIVNGKSKFQIETWDKNENKKWDENVER